jgi:single-stranded DNA-specific DHH superfamily exonuclease
VDIKAVLDGCGGKEVFERYGGHEMACGATVRGGMFGEAQRRFGKSLAKQCGGKRFVHQNRYDADLAPRMVVKELGDALMKTLYPYCAASNPEPVMERLPPLFWPRL